MGIDAAASFAKEFVHAVAGHRREIDGGSYVADIELMSTPRRNTFTGIAGRISKRFNEVSQPYLDRGEPVPADLLDREFKKMCRDYEIRHGITLNASDRAIILEKYVPRSANQWARRNQRHERTAT
jgi:hypothetical protein